MNSHQIDLVQQTFALAAPQAKAIANDFYTLLCMKTGVWRLSNGLWQTPVFITTAVYQRLFALDPTLRRLFLGDMSEQGDKLMTMLAFVVHHLRQPEPILGAIQRLGERHLHYGVQPHHYSSLSRVCTKAIGFWQPAATLCVATAGASITMALFSP